MENETKNESAQSGEKPSAVAVYLKELAANPADARLYYDIAFCYYRVGDFGRALEWAEKMVKAEPNDINTYYLIGGTARRMNEHRKAADAYSRILELAPAEHRTLYIRAQAYEEANMQDAALRDYSSYLALFPKDLEALVARAQLYRKLGQEVRAKRDCRRALKLDPRCVRAEVLLERLGEEAGHERHSARRRRLEEFAPIRITDLDLASVVGLDRVKRELRRDVIYPLVHADLAREYGVVGGGGMLVFGPPGCGKTFIAKAVAGEATKLLGEMKEQLKRSDPGKAAALPEAVPIVSANINEILNCYVGETEKNMHKVFEAARENAPSVLFFDEIDGLGVRRTAAMNRGTSEVMKLTVNQFLTELDGVASSNANVLVMGATNAPWLVDPALKRHGRLGKLLYVPPPSRDAREELFRKYLSGRQVEEVIDYASLAEAAAYCTGADIAAICDEANKLAWEEVIDSGERRKIGMGHLLSSIGKEKYNLGEWYGQAKQMLAGEGDKRLYSELADAIEAYERESPVAASQTYR